MAYRVTNCTPLESPVSSTLLDIFSITAGFFAVALGEKIGLVLLHFCMY
jgi:hypothetical protein